MKLDRTEQRVPRVGLEAALTRHWVLALLPLIVFVALGLGVGFARTVNYTADTRLAAGRLDASVPGSLSGFTEATEALAEVYSRSIRGDDIIATVSRRLDEDPVDVRRALSAAPVPQSAVFKVSATAETADQAVRRSVLASQTLVRQSERESRTSPEGVVPAYRRAIGALERNRSNVDRREAAYEDDDSTANLNALIDATSDAEVAELKVRTLQTAHAASTQSAGSVGVIKVIEHATQARSDRNSVLQLLLFVAVIAGLGTGLALALFRANREARRAIV